MRKYTSIEYAIYLSVGIMFVQIGCGSIMWLFCLYISKSFNKQTYKFYIYICITLISTLKDWNKNAEHIPHIWHIKPFPGAPINTAKLAKYRRQALQAHKTTLSTNVSNSVNFDFSQFNLFSHVYLSFGLFFILFLIP